MGVSVLGVWFLGLVVAYAGPVEKADKSLSAWQSGKAEALPKALAAADAAVEKGPEDGAAWGVKARVLLAVAEDPAADTQGDAASGSLEAFEKAVALDVEGDDRAALESRAPALEAVIGTRLANAIEGKQWQAAKTELDLALRARAVAAELGHADKAALAAVHASAARVTAMTGDHAGARGHYAKMFEASGQDDTGLAALVGRKIGDGGDPTAALAFLAPVSERHRDDERVMRAEVELLMSADRQADAVSRVDASYVRLSSSVSGAWLAATLYQVAGDAGKARVALDQVLALDARHVDAHVALAWSWLATGDELAEKLVANPKLPSKEKAKLTTERNQAYDKAIETARAATDLDLRNADAKQVHVDALKARLALLPSPPKSSADRALAGKLQPELKLAEEALASGATSP